MPFQVCFGVVIELLYKFHSLNLGWLSSSEQCCWKYTLSCNCCGYASRLPEKNSCHFPNQSQFNFKTNPDFLASIFLCFHATSSDLIESVERCLAGTKTVRKPQGLNLQPFWLLIKSFFAHLLSRLLLSQQHSPPHWQSHHHPPPLRQTERSVELQTLKNQEKLTKPLRFMCFFLRSLHRKWLPISLNQKWKMLRK